MVQEFRKKRWTYDLKEDSLVAITSNMWNWEGQLLVELENTVEA